MNIRNYIPMALFICIVCTYAMGKRPAFALPIFKYDISGTVTHTTPTYADLPDIQAGDTFIGHLAYEYDPTLEDQVPLDDLRAIYDSFGSYSIRFDNFEIQSNLRGYIPIELTLSTLKFYDFTPVTSDLWSDDLYFRFVSTNGPVFDDYAFPYGVDFNAFEEMTLWFDISGPALSPPQYEKLVTARIDSIVQVPIPEPGTLLLLISGLGIGTMVRRKI